ncbi:MAG: serine/threonine protein kinase, partial [Bradymonadaceae bacterium]
YMSPEQVRTNEVYPTTDLYALGIILFELLIGRPPIRGETSFEVMFGHIDQVPPSVTDLADDVPDHLAELVGD